MGNVSVHRLVEQQVAARGDHPAIMNDGQIVTYRDLNLRANAVARHLLASGFRRGGHAIVQLPRRPELAAVLLGVLKAGGSYSWLDPGTVATRYPDGVSIAVGRHETEDAFLAVDVDGLLADHVQPSPNLPILTRGSDIACVLPDDQGAAAVMVPHDTIVSLNDGEPPPEVGRWTGEGGALDLWLGLMAGTTVTIVERIAKAA